MMELYTAPLLLVKYMAHLKAFQKDEKNTLCFVNIYCGNYVFKLKINLWFSIRHQ